MADRIDAPASLTMPPAPPTIVPDGDRVLGRDDVDRFLDDMELRIVLDRALNRYSPRRLPAKA